MPSLLQAKHRQTSLSSVLGTIYTLQVPKFGKWFAIIAIIGRGGGIIDRYQIRNGQTSNIGGGKSHSWYPNLSLYSNAKPLALGPCVGLDPQRNDSSLGIPTCWYLKSPT